MKTWPSRPLLGKVAGGSSALVESAASMVVIPSKRRAIGCMRPSRPRTLLRLGRGLKGPKVLVTEETETITVRQRGQRGVRVEQSGVGRLRRSGAGDERRAPAVEGCAGQRPAVV